MSASHPADLFPFRGRHGCKTFSRLLGILILPIIILAIQLTCDSLFVERLRQNDPVLLKQGLVDLERLSKIGKGWEELTKGGADDNEETGGFSFGFGGDDEDDDIP